MGKDVVVILGAGGIGMAIAAAATYLPGPDAGFITDGDLLIGGSVIAALHAGKLHTAGAGD